MTRSMMPFVSAVFAVALAVSAGGVLGACAASGGGGTGLDGGGIGASPVGDLANAKAAEGNVQITLRLTPPGKPATSIALVNASSETGRKITSGKASSTQIRVVDDLAMGRIIMEMEARGFSANAAPGLTLDNLRDYAGRRGVIIVDQGGSTRGLDFGTGSGGTALPAAYVECKKLIMGVHSQIQGFEVRATTNSDEADRIFQGGGISMPRR